MFLERLEFLFLFLAELFMYTFSLFSTKDSTFPSTPCIAGLTRRSPNCYSCSTLSDSKQVAEVPHEFQYVALALWRSLNDEVDEELCKLV